MSAQPFADLPVIGALPRDAAAAKLREVGEDAAADAVERASPPPKTMRAGGWWPFSNRAWQQRIASAFCRLAAQADARKSSASARRKPMLQFEIENVGRVAAYDWQLSVRSIMTEKIDLAGRVADYHFGKKHVFDSGGANALQYKTIESRYYAMIYVIVASIIASLYLLHRPYCIIVRLKVRGVGIFRDHRRENDQR
jgi:hypothetical protein